MVVSVMFCFRMESTLSQISAAEFMGILLFGKMYGLLWIFWILFPKMGRFVENSIKNQFIISGFAPVCKIWAQFLGRAAL